MAIISVTTADMATLMSRDFTDSAYTLPDDYISVKELILNENPTVSIQRSNLLDVRYRAGVDSGGRPALFETTGDNLTIAPGPRANDTFELVYYARPPDDVGLADTNVYFNKFTPVILAAAMEEFYLSHQDPERSAQWGALYRERLALANNKESNELYSGYAVSTKNR